MQQMAKVENRLPIHYVDNKILNLLENNKYYHDNMDDNPYRLFIKHMVSMRGAERMVGMN